VNFFCALTFGELKILVNISEENLFFISCMQDEYPVVCIIPACILNGLFFVIQISYVVIPNLVLFLSAISNSELNFILYGKKENKFPMTLIGLLVDDIPQFILQVAYAIVENRKYYQTLSPIQIASFVFTLLRLFFVSYKKYKDEKHRKEGREEGKDYREVVMDGVAVAAEFFGA
jgi:hypothetical protein